MLFIVLVVSVLTRSIGIFIQERVGEKGKLFKIYKIKTMRIGKHGNLELIWFGAFLRNSKLDEFPQLFNVLFGDMSMVGPRPDVKGYADQLNGDNRIILTVKPGITGPATLKFFKEEQLLAQQQNPQEYNDGVLWPQKVEANMQYVQEWDFWKDLHYLWLTFKKLSG